MDQMIVIWAVLIVVFLVVEAATAGLASLWFAVGAIVALVVAFFHGALWLQITLFAVVSVITLVLTRPLAKKFVNGRTKATNADRVIGQTASITEKIDNVAGTGAAVVGGRAWTARSAGGEIIQVGTFAKIQSIEGVKLIVVPQPENILADKINA